jgi:hypothetical protein
VYVIIGLVSYLPKVGGSVASFIDGLALACSLSLYLYAEKHMTIQGNQLYVFMQCTCIDINMAELRE